MSPPKHTARSPPFDPRPQTSGNPVEHGSPGHHVTAVPSTHSPLRQEVPADEGPQEDAHHGAATEDQPHEDARQSITRQSSFRPIFTVIKDTNTSRYHHPNVRYIFSDDDTDAITEAALRSLQLDHHDAEPADTHTSPPRRKDGTSNKKQTQIIPPERYIVVDLHPSTAPEHDAPSITTEKSPNPETPSLSTAPHHRAIDLKVVSAHSLNPSWAVLDAKLSPAPTFDSSSNSPPGTQDEPLSVGDLMLNIEGTSGFDIPGTSGRQQRPEAPRQRTMEEMLEQFHKRMEELRLVVEAGERGPGKQQIGDETNKDEKGKAREH